MGYKDDLAEIIHWYFSVDNEKIENQEEFDKKLDKLYEKYKDEIDISEIEYQKEKRKIVDWHLINAKKSNEFKPKDEPQGLDGPASYMARLVSFEAQKRHIELDLKYNKPVSKGRLSVLRQLKYILSQKKDDIFW